MAIKFKVGTMASKFEVCVCKCNVRQVRGWCVGTMAIKFEIDVMASKLEVGVLV